MTRSVSLRLLAAPALAVVGLAVATIAPTRLAGAEIVSESELFDAANNPELLAYNRELSARLEQVAVRTSQKEDIVTRVIAGRIGLAEAADGFLQLNQESPECLVVMREHYPASDDRESAACNVLTFVSQRVKPADWPAVRARLAAEYRALFHHAPVQ